MAIKTQVELRKIDNESSLLDWLDRNDLGFFTDGFFQRRHRWTLENCKLEALKYKSRTEWSKGSASSYSIAHKRGWFDECTQHMGKSNKPRGYWTLGRCKAKALEYRTRSEWEISDKSSYRAAQKRGWLDKCCGHMEKRRKPNGYWTLERCKLEALKHKTQSMWLKNSPGSFNAARRDGWLAECCSHMIK